MNFDRNIVELKKNSVQISCFPTAEGRFIPHKDVSFPHLNDQHLHAPPSNGTAKYPGYLNLNGSGDQNGKLKSTFSNELHGDLQFLVESEPSDPALYAERLSSKSDGELFRKIVGMGDLFVRVTRAWDREMHPHNQLSSSNDHNTPSPSPPQLPLRSPRYRMGKSRRFVAGLQTRIGDPSNGPTTSDSRRR